MLMRCHYWIFNTRNIRETIDSFASGSYYHLFKRYLFILLTKMRTETKTRWALGFSVLRFQLFFRSVFWFLCQKTSVFRFWCSLRFADIPFFSIWFSVFAKNTSGFSDLISDAVFGFDIRCSFRFLLFDLFGFQFLFDLSGNYAPPLISNSR